MFAMKSFCNEKKSKKKKTKSAVQTVCILHVLFFSIANSSKNLEHTYINLCIRHTL